MNRHEDLLDPAGIIRGRKTGFLKKRFESGIFFGMLLIDSETKQGATWKKSLDLSGPF